MWRATKLDYSFNRCLQVRPRLLLRAALVLSACLAVASVTDSTGGERDSQAYSPIVELLDIACEDGLRCGYVTVDRPHLDGQLRLWVAAAGDPAGTAPPLVVLPGGPGIPGAGTAARSMGLFPAVADDRMVLYVDPRGTGLSDGRLRCPTPPASDWDECFAHVGATTDVARYSSESIADDIEALRVALQIEEWDVHGGSYGTEVVQHLLRRHPDHIRSAVMIHTAAVSVPQPADQIESVKEALATMARDCEREPACSAGARDLEDRWLTALQSLQDAPMPLTIDNAPPFLDSMQGVLLLSEFLEGGSSQRPFVQALESLERRDPTVWQEVFAWKLVPGWVPTNADQSESQRQASAIAHNLTLCLDGLASASPDSFPLGSWEQTWRGLDRRQPEVCELFGVAETAIDTSPATSAVPTLLLAGRVDPVTPLSQSQSVAAGLGNATLVEFPWYGHQGLWSDPCPQQIVTSFWNDPTSPVTQDCVAELTFTAVNDARTAG